MADAFTSDTYNALCREAEDYLGRGLTEQARELLLKAVSLIGTRSRARSLLADACMALGLWSEAGEQLEQLITLELGSVQHHYRLGQVLEELQEKEKALDNYRVVLDLEPSHRGASVAVSRMAGRAVEAGPEPEPPAAPARIPSVAPSGEVQVFPDEPGAEDVFATSGDVESLLRDIGVGQTGDAETGVSELLSSVGINLGPEVVEEKPVAEVTDVSSLMGTPAVNASVEDEGFSLESVFGGAPEPASAATVQPPAPAPAPAGQEPFDFTSIFRTAIEPAEPSGAPPVAPAPSAPPVEPAQPAESEPLLRSIFGEPEAPAGPPARPEAAAAAPAPVVEAPPAADPIFEAGAGSEPILQAVFGSIEPAGPPAPEPAAETAVDTPETESPLPSIFWEEPPAPAPVEPGPPVLEVAEPAGPAEAVPPVLRSAVEEAQAAAAPGQSEGAGDAPPEPAAPPPDAAEPVEPAPEATPEPPSYEDLPPLEAVFMADAAPGTEAVPAPGMEAAPAPETEATGIEVVPAPAAEAPAAHAADEAPEAVPAPAVEAGTESFVEPLPAEPAVESSPGGAAPDVVEEGAFSLEIVFGAASGGGEQPVPAPGDTPRTAPETAAAEAMLEETPAAPETAGVTGAGAAPEGVMQEGGAPEATPAAAPVTDAGAAPVGVEAAQTHVPALFDIHPSGPDDLLVVDFIEGRLELKLAYLMAFDSSMTITAEGPRRILTGTGMMVLGQAFRSPVILSLAAGDLVRGDRLVFSDAAITFAEAGTELLPSMLRVEGAGGQALAFTGGRHARVPLGAQAVSARAACVLQVTAGVEVSPDPDNPGFIRLRGDGSALVSP